MFFLEQIPNPYMFFSEYIWHIRFWPRRGGGGGCPARLNKKNLPRVISEIPGLPWDMLADICIHYTHRTLTDHLKMTLSHLLQPTSTVWCQGGGRLIPDRYEVRTQEQSGKAKEINYVIANCNTLPTKQGENRQVKIYKLHIQLPPGFPSRSEDSSPESNRLSQRPYQQSNHLEDTHAPILLQQRTFSPIF